MLLYILRSCKTRAKDTDFIYLFIFAFSQIVIYTFFLDLS